MISKSAIATISVGLVLAVTNAAQAGRFSDVPTSHTFHDAIERLADKGVVTGNPDGTFAPGKTVNRAEFLTMLYRSKGVTPSATAVCMRDIIAGSWYLPVVCDAIGKGYVGGYSDGTFKPQNPVNRAEAVKMLLTVLEFRVGDYTEADRMAIGYPDVSLSAWYTKYLAAAFRLGILPVAGQSGNAFGPEAPLTRAEAAAYIDSAIRVESIASSSSSAAAHASQESSAMTRSSAKSESSKSSLSIKDVTLPLSDTSKFAVKAPVLYRFSVDAKIVGEFTVSVAPGQGKGTSCTLYKLGDDSLPTEYYTGSVDDSRCFLRVAMPKGNYQLELRGDANGQFNLSSRNVPGDANDGFSDAKTLVVNKMKVGTLDVDDQADYYTFTVLTPTMYLLETSNTARTRCMIVPLADVDIFGFAAPECDKEFTYPIGTYVVIIDREQDLTWKMESYGVVLKPLSK